MWERIKCQDAFCALTQTAFCAIAAPCSATSANLGIILLINYMIIFAFTVTFWPSKTLLRALYSASIKESAVLGSTSTKQKGTANLVPLVARTVSELGTISVIAV